MWELTSFLCGLCIGLVAVKVIKRKESRNQNWGFYLILMKIIKEHGIEVFNNNKKLNEDEIKESLLEINRLF